MFKNNIFVCARGLFFILAIQCIIGLVSCGYYDDTKVNVAPGSDPSVVVKAIFSGTCLGCHDGSIPTPAVMNNPDGPTYLQNSAGNGGSYGAIQYIVPGDPDSSLIYKKITGAPGVGGQMPDGGPNLSASETEAFRQWITDLPH
jgi:hypothetical protein